MWFSFPARHAARGLPALRERNSSGAIPRESETTRVRGSRDRIAEDADGLTGGAETAADAEDLIVAEAADTIIITVGTSGDMHLSGGRS